MEKSEKEIFELQENLDKKNGKLENLEKELIALNCSYRGLKQSRDSKYKNIKNLSQIIDVLKNYKEKTRPYKIISVILSLFAAIMFSLPSIVLVHSIFPMLDFTTQSVFVGLLELLLGTVTGIVIYHYIADVYINIKKIYNLGEKEQELKDEQNAVARIFEEKKQVRLQKNSIYSCIVLLKREISDLESQLDLLKSDDKMDSVQDLWMDAVKQQTIIASNPDFKMNSHLNSYDNRGVEDAFIKTRGRRIGRGR